MHLNAPLYRIPSRLVAEASQIEVAPQFPINPRQQVQVECCRHARGIVIGQQLILDAFLQVRAQQQCIAFA